MSISKRNSLLRIRRFRAQYLVSNEHPAPERVKDRLDEAVRKQLAGSIASALSTWFPDTDPSLWLIRRLEIDVAVNAAWEREGLARSLSKEVVRTLGLALRDRMDQDNVVRFPNRRAYLASFLADLAAGDAWRRWYYESFAGLRVLPLSAALRTAICAEVDQGREALQQLASHDLQNVLRALTSNDARRIFESLNDSAAAANEFQCCQSAWQAWQTTRSTSFPDRWRQTLYLYVAASRHSPGGPDLKRAILALLKLVNKLELGSAKENHELIAVFTGGDRAALCNTVGSTDAETLGPFLRCPDDFVHEVAQTVAAPAETTTSDVAGSHRTTSFGGAFLLLPLLDELPFVESTRDWPNTDKAAAISLLRFLLLIKCCGQEEANRAFHDSLLRDLLLIPRSVSLATVSEWQSLITRPLRQALLTTLIAWHSSRRSVTRRKQILACPSLPKRTIAVLIDGARGLWLGAQRYSPRRPGKLIEELSGLLAQLENDDGLLLCDPSVLDAFWAAFPTLKMISLTDASQETRPHEDCPVDGIVSRLSHLADELWYLALPATFKVSQAFDLTLSVVAQHVLRMFAWRLPGFAGSNLPYLGQNFLVGAASIEDEPERRVVRLGRPPLHLILSMTGMARRTYRLSWLDERPFALFEET